MPKVLYNACHSLNKMKNSTKQFTVLLIEDNPGDVRLTQEAFRDTGQDVILEVAMDGVEAVQYLRKEGPFSDKALPDLILLDLNLPKWEGRDVLRKIKTDEKLRHIPVVVLTTSNAAQDILDTYHLHANCFINKPVDFDSFFNVIEKIQEFWLQTATLPSDVA